MATEYGPISQGLLTKYANGTIAQASPETIARMFATETVEQNVIPSTIIGDRLNDVFSQNLPGDDIGEPSMPGASLAPGGTIAADPNVGVELGEHPYVKP